MRSFSSVYPNLVPQWSAQNSLSPDEISYGSNKPIVWIGTCGHSWTATPKNRGHGHGCPICSGNKILPGINDLASRFPEISKEWADRNVPATPQEYGAHSNQSFWWKCSSCGREWLARIADRTDGHGCPHCLKESIASRKQARAEAHKRQILQNWRDRQIRRSLKEENFRLDSLAYYASLTGLEVEYDYDPGIGIPVKLYFPEKCAAIELTSYMNKGWTDWRYENAKNWLCLNSGITILRIIPKNMKAFENCKCVRIKSDSAESLGLALTQVFRKMKVPTDIDVSRDYEKIRRKQL